MTSPVPPGRDLRWLIIVAAVAAIALDWSVKQFEGRDPPHKDQPNSAPVTRASGSLPGLFSSDDYPEEALRRDVQGTVAFTLAIDRRGRVDSCAIAKSSGSDILDRATCDIIQRRARFTPARDTDGQPVADITSGRIRWQLPDL